MCSGDGVGAGTVGGAGVRYGGCGEVSGSCDCLHDSVSLHLRSVLIASAGARLKVFTSVVTA